MIVELEGFRRVQNLLPFMVSELTELSGLQTLSQTSDFFYFNILGILVWTKQHMTTLRIGFWYEEKDNYKSMYYII